MKREHPYPPPSRSPHSGQVMTRGVRDEGDLDAFTRAYIEAMLWSTNDESDEGGGEPLDKNYSASDIDDETMKLIEEDCADFVKRFGPLIESEPEVRGEDRWGRWELAGHDFWLNREGHGAGFWDGDWPVNGDKLSDACKQYGSFDLYVEDGVISYASSPEYYRSHRKHGGTASEARRPRGGWWVHWSNGSENGPFTSKSDAKYYADYWHGQGLETFKIDQVPGHDERMGPKAGETRHATVADFSTLPEIIAHAQQEGATHVFDPSPHGWKSRLTGTVKVYFPRASVSPATSRPSDVGQYEEACLWREHGYWHSPAPSHRTIVDRLPRGAETISNYLGRAGQQAAEAPRGVAARRSRHADSRKGISAKIEGHSLVIEANKEGRQELADAYERGGYPAAEELLAEALHERFVFVDPAWIGAMTDAPILVPQDGVDFPDDADHWIVLPDARVFWFPNYMVEDPWETLRTKGVVRFPEAMEPSTTKETRETRGRAKAEHLAKRFRVGSRVMMNVDAIENYGAKWDGVILQVTHVATSHADHPGFDPGGGSALYDLEVADRYGPLPPYSPLPMSLYDWELEPAGAGAGEMHSHAPAPHMQDEVNEASASSELPEELKSVIATLAHNRQFTPGDMADYQQTRSTLLKYNARALINKMVTMGYLEKTSRGHYFPTKAGWAWIEGGTSSALPRPPHAPARQGPPGAPARPQAPSPTRPDAS